MGKYTWAYINTTAEATATAAAGVSGSIQFKGESARFDGDSNLTFNQGTNTLHVTGTVQVDGHLSSSGNISAKNYVLEEVTVAFSAGPTAFGDSADDTHAFTGDITVSDALTVTGLTTLNGQTTLNETVDVNKTTSGIAVDIDTDQSNPALSAKTTNTAPTQGVVWVDTEDITHANAVGLWVGDKSDRSVGDRLGGATLAKFYSFSNNTSERDLVHIHNKNSSANAAQGLVIENAADPTGNNRDLLVKGSSANRFWVDHEGACIGPTNTRRGKLHIYSAASDNIGASIHLNSGQASADRKPLVAFFNDGTRKFTLGSDGADSMKFKIGTTALETNTFFEANTSGEITALGSDTPSLNQVLTWDGSKAVWELPGGGVATSLVNGSGHAVISAADNVHVTLDSDDSELSYFRVLDGDGFIHYSFSEKGEAIIRGHSGSAEEGAKLFLSASNSTAGNAPEIYFRKTDASVFSAGDNLGAIRFQGTDAGVPNSSSILIIGEVANGTIPDASAESWSTNSQMGAELRFQIKKTGTNTFNNSLVLDGLGAQIGGRLYGPTGNHFEIKSDNDIKLHLDADNSGDSSAIRVYDGSGTEVLYVTEGGTLAADGNVAAGGGWTDGGVTVYAGGTVRAASNITSNATLIGNALDVGGGFGSSGVTIAANGDISSDGILKAGGGFGSTGATITAAGVINADGIITTKQSSVDTDHSACVSLDRYSATISSGNDVGLIRWRASEDDATFTNMGYILVEADQDYNVASANDAGSRMKFALNAQGNKVWSNVMELDGVGNLQIDNDLTLGTNGVVNVNSGNMYLRAENHVEIHIDDDGGDTSMLIVRNGADQNVFEVNEVGGVGIGMTTDGAMAERLHVKGSSVPIRARLETDDGYDLVYTGYQGSTQKMALGYDDSVDRVRLRYGGMSTDGGLDLLSAGGLWAAEGGFMALFNTNTTSRMYLKRHDPADISASETIGAIHFQASEQTSNVFTDNAATIMAEPSTNWNQEVSNDTHFEFWCTPSGASSNQRAMELRAVDTADCLQIDGNIAQDAFFSEGHQYPSTAAESELIEQGDCLALIDGELYRTSSPMQKNVAGIAWYRMSDKKCLDRISGGSPFEPYSNACTINPELISDEANPNFGKYYIIDETGSTLIFDSIEHWNQSKDRSREFSKKWIDSLGNKYDLVERQDVTEEWTPTESFKRVWKTISLGDSRQFIDITVESNNVQKMSGFKVCDEGGSISAGDLLCTSSKTGRLMKQPDDLMHSYTVAKAMEDVTFDADGNADGVYGYVYCG